MAAIPPTMQPSRTPVGAHPPAARTQPSAHSEQSPAPAAPLPRVVRPAGQGAGSVAPGGQKEPTGQACGGWGPPAQVLPPGHTTHLREYRK